MARRRTPRRRRTLGAANESCWDLYETITKLHRRIENAEYRLYERGLYPKTGTRADAADKITKMRVKYDALNADWKKRGC
jgi:hypothetical protein